ncbi:unnamed protein product, partial [Owenia fusiformis]
VTRWKNFWASFSKFYVYILTLTMVLLLIRLFNYKEHLKNNGIVEGEHQVSETNLFDPSDGQLVEYIRENWIHSPSVDVLDISEPLDHDFSQFGQSKVIDKLLNAKTRGFFIECGAMNGKDLSNTLYFERFRKWTGILVEPHPESFSDLIKLKRNAYAANILLCPSNEQRKLPFIYQSMRPGYSALKDINMMRDDDIVNAYKLQIQCFTVYTLLRAVGTKYVDYFSLDVEGAEMAVLKTIPFDKVYIKVFTIEFKFNDGHVKDTRKSLERLTEFRQFFKQTGLYKEVGIIPENLKGQLGHDVIFERID